VRSGVRLFYLSSLRLVTNAAASAVGIITSADTESTELHPSDAAAVVSAGVVVTSVVAVEATVAVVLTVVVSIALSVAVVGDVAVVAAVVLLASLVVAGAVVSGASSFGITSVFVSSQPVQV
jgi:hypothetical protein